MKVEKTVKSAVVKLTNVKHKQLTQMWENYQRWLQTKDDNIELYSAHKQQAKRNLDFNRIRADKEYPLFIRKDLLSIQKCDSDLADYFFKIPSKQRYGGIKVPIKTHMDIKDNHELCETKLLKKGDKFFLHIMISKDVFIREHYQGVLSIDLGLRQPVVSVALPGRDTMLEGDRIRDTQTRYFYLRRNTRYGSNRSRFYDREYNIVEDEIHKITTKLVRYAKKNDLMIVVGNLKDIQNEDKGRCMNRKLHRWPHYKFRQYLEYKAHWNGIAYKEIEEAYTSQICSRCNYIGDRNKGLFKCDNCGLEIHSDKNGAQNIGRRALGKLLKPLSDAGDSVTSPGAGSDDLTSLDKFYSFAKSKSGMQPQ